MMQDTSFVPRRRMVNAKSHGFLPLTGTFAFVWLHSPSEPHLWPRVCNVLPSPCSGSTLAIINRSMTIIYPLRTPRFLMFVSSWKPCHSDRQWMGIVPTDRKNGRPLLLFCRVDTEQLSCVCWLRTDDPFRAHI